MNKEASGRARQKYAYDFLCLFHLADLDYIINKTRRHGRRIQKKNQNLIFLRLPSKEIQQGRSLSPNQIESRREIRIPLPLRAQDNLATVPHQHNLPVGSNPNSTKSVQKQSPLKNHPKSDASERDPSRKKPSFLTGIASETPQIWECVGSSEDRRGRGGGGGSPLASVGRSGRCLPLRGFTASVQRLNAREGHLVKPMGKFWHRRKGKKGIGTFSNPFFWLNHRLIISTINSNWTILDLISPSGSTRVWWQQLPIHQFQVHMWYDDNVALVNVITRVYDMDGLFGAEEETCLDYLNKIKITSWLHNMYSCLFVTRRKSTFLFLAFCGYWFVAELCWLCWSVVWHFGFMMWPKITSFWLLNVMMI